jgi:hypothetical protein
MTDAEKVRILTAALEDARGRMIFIAVAQEPDDFSRQSVSHMLGNRAATRTIAEGAITLIEQAQALTC